MGPKLYTDKRNKTQDRLLPGGCRFSTPVPGWPASRSPATGGAHVYFLEARDQVTSLHAIYYLPGSDEDTPLRFVVFLLLLFVFLRQGFNMCSSGKPGTFYEDMASLERACLTLLGLKGHTTTLSHMFLPKNCFQ